jgi:hypothetical protein
MKLESALQGLKGVNYYEPVTYTVEWSRFKGRATMVLKLIIEVKLEIEVRMLNVVSFHQNWFYFVPIQQRSTQGRDKVALRKENPVSERNKRERKIKNNNCNCGTGLMSKREGNFATLSWRQTHGGKRRPYFRKL